MERTRDIGLLHAVGMSTTQLRWMFRTEAVLVATVAVAVGVGAGIVFAA